MLHTIILLRRLDLMPESQQLRPPVRSAPHSTHGDRAERTYVRLLKLIIRGQLPPGARAVESELAGRFGVSRTPVRESLARLAREGFLVPSTSGRRTELVVAPLRPEDVVELWGIIGVLEGLAIQAVATMRAEDRSELVADLERINADLMAVTSARPRDSDLVFELQTRFHICFMDRCAGPRLRALYDSVRPHVRRYEWAYGTQADAPYAPSIDEHRRLIAAIASGDPRNAKEVVERHWAEAATRTGELIARFGG